MSQSVNLDSADWQNEDPGVRTRAVQAGGSRWVLVEYEPLAQREDWCIDGHRGYVLKGRIEYDFQDKSPSLVCTEGQGILLEAGKGHRGRNPSNSTTQL